MVVNRNNSRGSGNVNRPNNPRQPDPEEYEEQGSILDRWNEEEVTFSSWLESRVRETPWWLVSVVFHILIVLIGTQIKIESQEIVEEKRIIISPQIPIQEEIKFEPPKPNVENVERASEEHPDDEPLPKAQDIKNVSDDDDVLEEMKGDRDEFKTDARLYNKGLIKEIGLGVGAFADRFGGPDGSKEDKLKKGCPGRSDETE